MNKAIWHKPTIYGRRVEYTDDPIMGGTIIAYNHEYYVASNPMTPTQVYYYTEHLIKGYDKDDFKAKNNLRAVYNASEIKWLKDNGVINSMYMENI